MIECFLTLGIIRCQSEKKGERKKRMEEEPNRKEEVRKGECVGKVKRREEKEEGEKRRREEVGSRKAKERKEKALERKWTLSQKE